MMNIAIVGGAGYIGSYMSKLLHKSSVNHIIIDDLSTGYAHNILHAPFFNYDIGNSSSISRILADQNINLVMHFAAKTYVGESVRNPRDYYDNNVVKTLSLLNTMVDLNIRNFIFSSTCATYGVPDSLPIREDLTQNPISPYGQTKLVIEKILKDYEKAYNLKHIILRYFNAAGADPEGLIGEEHNPETHLIPLIFESIVENKPILIFGDDYPTLDGTCVRDYVHIHDLAEAHLQSIKYLINTNHSNNFNLGSESGYSVLEVIKVIENVTGKKVLYKIVSRREGDPPVLLGDSSKAFEILNWTKKYTLEDIIKHAWTFFNNKRAIQ